jgi:hypothetical protein
MHSPTKHWITGAIAASVIALISSASAQNTYYVSKSGLDANSGLTTAAAKLTIQAAINVAPANSIIYVLPSATTYTQSLTFGAGKSGIQLLGPRVGQSALNWTPVSGQEAIIQHVGTNAAITISVNGHANNRVEGFHIVGASGASTINIAQNTTVSSVTICNNFIQAGLNGTGSTNGIHYGRMTGGEIHNNVITNGRNPLQSGAGLGTNANAADDFLANNVIIRHNWVYTTNYGGSGTPFNIAPGYDNNCLFLENIFGPTQSGGAFGNMAVIGGTHINGRFIRNRIITVPHTTFGNSYGFFANPPGGTTNPAMNNNVIEETILDNVGTIAGASGNATTQNNKFNYNIALNPGNTTGTKEFATGGLPFRPTDIIYRSDASTAGSGVLDVRNNWTFGAEPNTTSFTVVQDLPNFNYTPYVGQPGVDENDGTSLTVGALNSLSAGNGVLTAQVDVTPSTTSQDLGAFFWNPATTTTQDVAILVLDSNSTSGLKPGVGALSTGRIERSYRYVNSLAKGKHLTQIRLPYDSPEISGFGGIESRLYVGKYDHITKSWIPAVDENTTGTALNRGTASVSTTLGTFGVDTTNKFAYANIDQSGEYTILSAPVAGFVTSASLTTIDEKNGPTQAFVDVVLESAPTTTVLLNVTTNDPATLSLSASVLSFDNTNWNVPQTITVTAIDDFIVGNPSRIASVLFSKGATADVLYRSSLINAPAAIQFTALPVSVSSMSVE